MSAAHPSILLAEEMAERGWSRDEVRKRTDAWRFDPLGLDHYLDFGAALGMVLGSAAEKLDEAFDVAPGFFQARSRTRGREGGLREVPAAAHGRLRRQVRAHRPLPDSWERLAVLAV